VFSQGSLQAAAAVPFYNANDHAASASEYYVIVNADQEEQSFEALAPVKVETTIPASDLFPHPKLAAFILFMSEWEPMCRDCYWWGDKNCDWSTVFYFEIIENIQFLIRKF
jgi:hypothetical protein